MSRFRVEADGEVIDAGGILCVPLGRVAQIGATEHFVALDWNGYALAGPTTIRDLAALTVVRLRYPEATLADLVS